MTMTISHSGYTLYTYALKHIQSDSIREWAQTAHNKPIIIKMAKEAVKKNPQAKPEDFATYLNLCAMGM